MDLLHSLRLLCPLASDPAGVPAGPQDPAISQQMGFPFNGAPGFNPYCIPREALGTGCLGAVFTTDRMTTVSPRSELLKGIVSHRTKAKSGLRKPEQWVWHSAFLTSSQAMPLCWSTACAWVALGSRGQPSGEGPGPRGQGASSGCRGGLSLSGPGLPGASWLRVVRR